MAAPFHRTWRTGAAALVLTLGLAACGQDPDAGVPAATDQERNALEDAGAMIAPPTPTPPAAPLPGQTPQAVPPAP